MEKHLKIIVIAAMIIILVFLSLIVFTMMNDKNQESLPAENNNEEIHTKKDYPVAQGAVIYADNKVIMGDSPKRIAGVLDSIAYENGEAIGFNITGTDGSTYSLQISDMKLIDISYSDDPEKEEVDLTFKTGGIARMVPGSLIYLYMDDNNQWSLDQRVLFGGQIEKTSATIVDFVFSSMHAQNGNILASYIVMQDASGQQINLYFSAINVQSIVSGGEMTVYYNHDATDENVYNVRVEDGFSMQLTTNDGGSYTLTKGGVLNLQKSSTKGYWELEKTIDKSLKRAVVHDITFSHDDENITGIDYIVAVLDDQTLAYLTILQTQALYGEPGGNYKRIYRYDGQKMVIDDVEPNDDFVMMLNNAAGQQLPIRIGSEIWISKSDDDIYMMDYQHTYSIYESQRAD